MTTKDEIRQWLNEGKRQKATHMLVVCDTFDHEDYPVYVEPEQNVKDCAKEYNSVNMQRIMECYDLSISLDEQLEEIRSFHGWPS